MDRGLLLDGVVLAANLLVMPALTRAFIEVGRRAERDPGAAWVLFAGTVALFVLAPTGAVLKRWHYHQGHARPDPLDAHALGGCLFNPIFYFCLVAVIFSAIAAFLTQELLGRREPGPGFVLSILGGLALIITHTWLVYRYFSPPARPPRSAFLRSPASAYLGDACLFLNMMLFQVLWNALSFVGIGPPGGPVEAVLRLLLLCFLALLLYFPPRMFYLAEDIGRPRTWLFILAANAPVIARMLLGTRNAT